MRTAPAALCVLILLMAGCGGGGGSSPPPSAPPPVVSPPVVVPPPPPSDASLAPVQQFAPVGGVSTSAHYSLVFTLGPSSDSTAAVSQHYRLQGGLSGADITLP
jgi:hypothetical protein